MGMIMGIGNFLLKFSMVQYLRLVFKQTEEELRRHEKSKIGMACSSNTQYSYGCYHYLFLLSLKMLAKEIIEEKLLQFLSREAPASELDRETTSVQDIIHKQGKSINVYFMTQLGLMRKQWKQESK